jgi:hypothetical protein
MSFFKRSSGQPNSSGPTILNPIQDSNTNNNINIYREKDSNKFRTNYHFDFQNQKKKKLLVPVDKNIFDELNNNRLRTKNHKMLPFKSLLIKDEVITFENFTGQVKIWLIFNVAIQVLDYIIQIIPHPVFENNRNQNLKKLINKLLREINCEIILNALKKFGINVDKQRTENCKKFRWSFHLIDIPFRQIKLNNSNNSNNNNGTNFPYKSGPVILNPISRSQRAVLQPNLQPSSYLSREPPNNN